jgi:hypothetical protein
VTPVPSAKIIFIGIMHIYNEFRAIVHQHRVANKRALAIAD